MKSGRRCDRRAGRGRRIDDAYRGPVNLAVFASEIPRFAGPIVVTPASTFARDNARARAPKKRDVVVPPPPGLWAVWKPNLQPDFNVRICDSFDASSSAVLRELDESNRSVQKSAESTSI